MDHIKYYSPPKPSVSLSLTELKEYFDDMRVEKRQLVIKLIEEGQSDEQIAAGVIKDDHSVCQLLIGQEKKKMPKRLRKSSPPKGLSEVVGRQGEWSGCS